MMLILADAEYRFGVGPLLCRVTEIIAPVLFDDILWWHLNGECADGTPDHHSGWQTRELYVIDSAISGNHPPPHGRSEIVDLVVTVIAVASDGPGVTRLG